jgi:hypothetical protein
MDDQSTVEITQFKIERIGTAIELISTLSTPKMFVNIQDCQENYVPGQFGQR